MRRLALRPGDRALDLGCGTGLSLPLLREAVGGSGRLYGAELSPDMLAVARAKVQSAGWRNVDVIEANAETFEIDEPVDGILCFYTHDIMLSPTALPRAIRHQKRGGRVTAAGGQLMRGWVGWLVNPVTIAYSLPAVTTLDRARSYEPFALMRQSSRTSSSTSGSWAPSISRGGPSPGRSEGGRTFFPGRPFECISILSARRSCPPASTERPSTTVRRAASSRLLTEACFSYAAWR